MLVSVVRILSAILLKKNQTFFTTLTETAASFNSQILKKKKGKKSIFSIAIGFYYITSISTVVNWRDCHQNFQHKYTNLKEQEAAKRVNWKDIQQSQLRQKIFREHEIMCHFQIPVSNKLQALFY